MIFTTLSISCCKVAAQVIFVTPGQYLRGQAAGAVVQFAGAVGEWGRQNRELENEIVIARRQFWEASEDSERAAAAEHYEHALIKKDLHFLVASVLQFSDPAGSEIQNS